MSPPLSSHHGAPHVMAYGEVLWDKLPTGPVLGGAPANFASRVQSLGTRSTLVSRVGADKLGDETVALLASMGLGTAHVQRDHLHPTGTVEVTFDHHGSPSYTINANVAYDHVAITPELISAARSAGLIYFGTLVQRSEISRKTLQTLLAATPGTTKLLDINLRKDCFTAETVADSLKAADILKLNEVEVSDISELLDVGETRMGMFTDILIKRFDLKTILITRGPKGVYAKNHTGERQELGGYEVQVVDTIGAGDAFTAGFVWAHIRGASLLESCELGVRCGALVATHRGGMVPVTMEELMALPFTAKRSAT